MLQRVTLTCYDQATSRDRAVRIVAIKVEINKLRKKKRKKEGIYLVGEIFIGLALLVRARRHFSNSGSDP